MQVQFLTYKLIVQLARVNVFLTGVNFQLTISNFQIESANLQIKSVKSLATINLSESVNFEVKL
jgi:hypothetical protein